MCLGINWNPAVTIPKQDFSEMGYAIHVRKILDFTQCVLWSLKIFWNLVKKWGMIYPHQIQHIIS